MSNLSELLPAGGGQNNTDFVADGAIASGKPVILNSAGTVSEVSATTVSVDMPQGSLATADSSHEVANNSCAIDISSNKAVAVARDGSNSSYMSVYVGDINTSTGAISWSGTRTFLTSANTQYPMIVADLNATGKFIVTYQSNSEMRVAIITLSGNTPSFNGSDASFGDTNGEYAIIAADPNTSGSFVAVYNEADSGTRHVLTTAFTYSGNTITVGTEVEISTVEIDTPKKATIKFDRKTAGKFAIAWRNNASPHYLHFQAATISGTTVTAGTAVVADSSATDWPRLAFDGNTAGKFAIAYWDTSGSDFTVICGNLSGTVPTFGTAVDFTTAGTMQEIQAFVSWPDLADTYGIVYKANSSKAHGRKITTSGTTPSAGTEVQLHTNTMSGAQLSGCANPASKGGLLAMWTTNTGSNPLESIYSQIGYTSTNLASTNLIGVASAAISDTATGTINTWGSRNEVQTSLTIASSYYVQIDGTITTTSTSPAQLIGQAITTTQINIKDYTG